MESASDKNETPHKVMTQNSDSFLSRYTYLFLLAFLFVLLAVILFFVIQMIDRDVSSVSRVTCYFLSILFLIVFVYFSLNCLLQIVSIYLKKDLTIAPGVWLRFLIMLSTPVLAVGRRLGLERDKIIDSLIILRNLILTNQKAGVLSAKILMLLPRCLQFSGCNQRIMEDISNCLGCGKCDIVKIAEMSKKYNIKIVTAIGGEAALSAIVQQKPTLVIAVACEKELLSGIKESLNVATICVPNERPNGPCKDTRVDTMAIERIIRQVITS